jgi:hypothetical protein
MSCRLLGTWQTSGNQRQYFIDDLESFAWVLLWSSLEILSAKQPLNGLASEWQQMLHTLNIKTGKIHKESIWGKIIRLRELAPIPNEVFQILRQWFNLCDTINVKDDNELDQMESKEHDEPYIYRKMVAVVLEALPNAPDRW